MRATATTRATLRARWLYRRPLSHHVNRIAGAIGKRLIRFAARDSNMLRYAKDEWAIAFTEYDEMKSSVGQSIFDVVAIFSLEGHSGFSANYTIGFIEKALRFDPFSPLQGTDDEWTDVGGYSDVPAGTFFQNKRLSSVFKENGRCYDIDGSPIYMEPSGDCYSKGGERTDIEFPYVKADEREIIYVDDGGMPVLPPATPDFGPGYDLAISTLQSWHDGFTPGTAAPMYLAAAIRDLRNNREVILENPR